MLLRNVSMRRVSISGRTFTTHGLPRQWWNDLYHYLMTIRWPGLFATFGCFFLVFNLLFATVYALQPGAVANLNPRGYWGLFFFSVETLATVGYGDMHPQTLYAHIVASVEIFVGMMSLALITGMMFARFSLPKARFLFAKHAVICPFDGRLTLILRAANARQNVVMEANAQLRLIRDERTPEGNHFRRIYDLRLRRSEQPVFLFGWNLMHVIEGDSPLVDATAESLGSQNAFLLLTLSGVDETTGQTLIAGHEYRASALRWDHVFADILTKSADGTEHFDYARFHDVEPRSPS